MDEHVLIKSDVNFGGYSTNTVSSNADGSEQFITWRPKGVCAKLIAINVVKGKISEVFIDGGCSGNGQGISRLLVGMTPKKAIRMLEGIKCLHKETSCPDQIAKALKRI